MWGSASCLGQCVAVGAPLTRWPWVAFPLATEQQAQGRAGESWSRGNRDGQCVSRAPEASRELRVTQ